LKPREIHDEVGGSGLGNKKGLIIIFVLFFLSGFLVTVLNYRPRVKLGDRYIYCNPNAKLKKDQIYKLQLWDTNWPVLQEGDYSKYLTRLVRDFQKQYPNVQVRIRLMDLWHGPEQLAAALKANSAPDVYCSAFSIPKFHWKRQIPVGFYLKREEKEAYFPEVRRLVSRYGVECYLPRWIAPTIWVGNQVLFDAVKLPRFPMQTPGYSWEELISGSKKLSKSKYLLVGNLGHNGFFTDLTVDFGAGIGADGNILSPKGMLKSLHYLNDLIGQRRIPTDLESNMLGRFMAGDSLLLAGVRPVMYRFVKWKLSGLGEENKPYEPVIIPPPGVGSKRFLLTENGVICVYRNRWTTGDDQISAAVKLAQFISVYEQTQPFQEMMLIPAARKNARQWCRALAPQVGDVSSLLDLIENRSLINMPDYRMYQKEIYPVLQEFFARKASYETVRDRLGNVVWK
jgi:hypothetical protein